MIRCASRSSRTALTPRGVGTDGTAVPLRGTIWVEVVLGLPGDRETGIGYVRTERPGPDRPVQVQPERGASADPRQSRSDRLGDVDPRLLRYGRRLPIAAPQTHRPGELPNEEVPLVLDPGGSLCVVPRLGLGELLLEFAQPVAVRGLAWGRGCFPRLARRGGGRRASARLPPGRGPPSRPAAEVHRRGTRVRGPPASVTGTKPFESLRRKCLALVRDRPVLALPAEDTRAGGAAEAGSVSRPRADPRLAPGGRNPAHPGPPCRAPGRSRRRP